MHPIALVSVIVWAIALERFWALYRRYDIDADHLMARVQTFVLANDVEGAVKLCDAKPTAALARVLKAGLTRARYGEDEVRDAVEVATIEVTRGLHKRTHVLPTLANMATLLGLLGTIVGLIQAFSAVALAPPEMKSQLLTQALAIGLNATAFGLTVAIPALGLYMVLNGATKKIVEDVDEYSLKLEALLARRRARPQPAPSPQPQASPSAGRMAEA
jgi:biopolymer transport protein ExbB/TolQ